MNTFRSRIVRIVPPLTAARNIQQKHSDFRNVTAISACFLRDHGVKYLGSGRRLDSRFLSTTRANHEEDFFKYSNEFGEVRPKTALVMGSSGSLGRCLAKHLSKDLDVRVIGADVVEPRKKDESYLSGGFVELPTIPTSETTTEPASLPDLTMALVDGLHQLLDGDASNDQELDAVICVAGAWEGDPAPLPPLTLNDNDGADNDEDTSRRMWLAEGANAYAKNIEGMMGKNLYPVLAAGYACQHYMTAGSKTAQDEFGEFTSDDNDGGLFVAIGATAALGGTPGMMGYGLSKVATHHFLQTLGETSGKAMTHKSKRKAARSFRLEHPSKYLNRLSVVGILPTTIDTPANRQAMPDANFDEWTKCYDIATEIGLWLRKPALRPHSGSLVKVHPKKIGSGAEFRVVR